ncbi:hypothetical protein NL676_028811 [Syzygium grande]|nr:hypothetical protein NL676_028811 [Syzygium grande]
MGHGGVVVEFGDSLRPRCLFSLYAAAAATLTKREKEGGVGRMTAHELTLTVESLLLLQQRRTTIAAGADPAILASAMLASRCKLPGISTPLSVGTFVKHLAVPISTRLHCALVDAEGGANGQSRSLSEVPGPDE